MSPPALTPAPKVITPRPLAWHGKMAASLLYGFIRVFAFTLRKSIEDNSGILGGGPPQRAIFAIWHNRLFLSLSIYPLFIRRDPAQRKLAAMVSASRDGGMVARILEHFGDQPVRGSSSRRGPQALREMTSWAEAGYDLAITPDGPRGPCYQVQEGVIALAQLTGLPIIPASYELSWKVRLKSWDRFQVPLPFARWKVKFAPAMIVPREADEAQREALRQQLEATMKAITAD